jgi:hypothetical protein
MIVHYPRYRLFLSMVISSFTRVYYLEEIGECSPLIDNITEAQDNARKALYLASFAEQEPSDEALTQMVHTLCDSILRAAILPMKIFGPVEFAFCLFMKGKDGKYRPINHLTAFFAGIQWSLRMILAHIIRLHHDKSLSYIPYSPPVALSTPATLSPPHSTENTLGLTDIIKSHLLENVAPSSQFAGESGHEDELEAVLDQSSEIEDCSGEESPRDTQIIGQETTGSELDVQILLKNIILSENSEGLLK